MGTIMFWCGAAIVGSLTFAICAAIVGGTIVAVKKMFDK